MWTLRRVMRRLCDRLPDLVSRHVPPALYTQVEVTLIVSTTFSLSREYLLIALVLWYCLAVVLVFYPATSSRSTRLLAVVDARRLL